MKATQLSICLDCLDEWNRRRRAAASFYHELLEPHEEIIRPRIPEGCRAVRHLYAIRCAHRDELAAFLNKQGIGTGFHCPVPSHFQPAYSRLEFSKGSFPRAEAGCGEIFSLAIFPDITP